MAVQNTTVEFRRIGLQSVEQSKEFTAGSVSSPESSCLCVFAMRTESPKIVNKFPDIHIRWDYRVSVITGKWNHRLTKILREQAASPHLVALWQTNSATAHNRSTVFARWRQCARLSKYMIPWMNHTHHCKWNLNRVRCFPQCTVVTSSIDRLVNRQNWHWTHASACKNS